MWTIALAQSIQARARDLRHRQTTARCRSTGIRQENPEDAEAGNRSRSRESQGGHEGLQVSARIPALEEEFSISAAMIEARSRAGMTREQVALRMKTTQAVIARLEGGGGKPSDRTLERYAKATVAAWESALNQPRPALVVSTFFIRSRPGERAVHSVRPTWACPTARRRR